MRNLDMRKRGDAQRELQEMRMLRWPAMIASQRSQWASAAGSALVKKRRNAEQCRFASPSTSFELRPRAFLRRSIGTKPGAASSPPSRSKMASGACSPPKRRSSGVTKRDLGASAFRREYAMTAPFSVHADQMRVGVGAGDLVSDVQGAVRSIPERLGM